MYDYVLRAGKIYTMNDLQPEAGWVAVKDGKIAETGNGEIPEASKIMDFGGATVIPGLMDPHIHGTVAAIFEKGVSLAECANIQEVLDKIEARCKTEQGELVVAHSLMVPFLAESRWPKRSELDQISNGKKVIAVGYDMHGSVVNTRALESIEIDSSVMGVEVENGEITGQMSSDDAHFLTIGQVLGQYSNDEMSSLVDDYIQKCLSYGLTGVHVLEGSFVEKNRDIKIWMDKKHKAPFHIVVYPQVWDMDSVEEFQLPRHGGCITLDGSDMNYTMAMAEPYTNKPETRGFLMREDAMVYKLVSRAHAEGKQCAFHALGERAIDQILWIYDRVIKEQGDKDLRHRIEHFTMATDEQIEHAARLGCVVIPQPELASLFDMPSVEEQFGKERAARMERYRVWTDKGLIVCGSSDVPINGLNPLKAIHELVNNVHDTRRLDVTTALKYYTVNPAYAAHEEKERGKICPGFFADFTVLDRNPYMEPGQIHEFSVIATITEGNLVYQKENQGSI